MLQRIVIILVCLLFSILTELPIYAGVIEYNLEISQEDVNITGKPVPAMTINGTIPGPTLRFREGDTARIHVHNKMKVDISVHAFFSSTLLWHREIPAGS